MRFILWLALAEAEFGKYSNLHILTIGHLQRVSEEVYSSCFSFSGRSKSQRKQPKKRQVESKVGQVEGSGNLGGFAVDELPAAQPDYPTNKS